MTTPYAVAADDLSFTFPGRTEPTLKSISCRVAPGSWTLIAGKTGSGKSTFLRAMAGQIPAMTSGSMHGSVALFANDTRALHPRDLPKLAGLVWQTPDAQLCSTTVAGEIAFGLTNLGLPAAEITARVTTWRERFQLPSGEDQASQTLSGGQKQQLLLASILAMGPKLLLLDEPLAQLDFAGTTQLLAQLAALRDAGYTIVVAEHRLEDLLPQVDRVLVLDDGNLAADLPASDAGVSACLAQVGFDEVKPPAQSPGDARTALQVGTPLVAARDLTVAFDRQLPPVWQQVHLQVWRGESVAIVGANGTGKSTLLRVLVGLDKRQHGTVVCAPPEAGRTALALVPQNPDLTLFANTVREELAFGPRQLGLAQAVVAQRVVEAADLLAIGNLLDEAPLALSQGQRLRVAVAATLTMHPQVLLLDEPTTGQDPGEARRLLAALQTMKDAGRVGALVFSTHDARLVMRHATRAVVLSEGALVADVAPAELATNDALLRQARLRPCNVAAQPGASAGAPQ